MRSQDSEQQILNAIESQFRSDDPALAACFIAFTTVTRNTGMPPSEQWAEGLPAARGRRRRRGTRVSCARLIQRVMLLFAGITMFFQVPEAISRMS